MAEIEMYTYEKALGLSLPGDWGPHSPCLFGFLSDAPVSSHSHRTRRLGQLTSLNCM